MFVIYGEYILLLAFSTKDSYKAFTYLFDLAI